MEKFRFRYQSVKNVKEIFEEKARTELSLIQKDIIAKESEIEQKRNQIESIKASRINMRKISELNIFLEYSDSLTSQLNSLIKELNFLINKKSAKISELSDKSKEVKIFESLEEIHLENHLVESKRRELVEVNEMAVQNYIRRTHEK